MMHPNEGSSLLIMVGLDFYLTEAEWFRLLQFAKAGNEIVIFCSNCDDKVQNLFKFSKYSGYEQLPITDYNPADSNEKLLRFSKEPTRFYGYKGRSIQGFFSINDSVAYNDTAEYTYKINFYNSESIYVSCNPDTLALMNTRPDFIRYTVGDGHISIHAAPLVLSNYFLLQKDNRDYLDAIWQTLPSGISNIYWNDYYKRSPGSTYFGAIFRYPATTWAFWLALLVLGMYVLFESKRRQRIIPVIKPLENTSVSFVETVGRLYFNKGNHANMAEKMILHFLEWVRTRFSLNTNELDDKFIKQLSLKSGQPENNVRYLVDMIHEVRLRTVNVNDPYLYELYKNIQQYYKNK
jgi:hypothetical protein